MVYVFLLPFSAVTTILNVFNPYDKFLVPKPDNDAFPSWVVALIEIELASVFLSV